MKTTLIRLHTVNHLGVFDCDFHDDIDIEKNSEIALHSLSVERQNKSLIVNASNSEFVFRVSENSITRTVNLDHETISSVNFFPAMRTLYDRMNSSLRFFRGTPQQIIDGDIKNTKETGTQIKIHADQKKNIVIDFRHSTIISLPNPVADDSTIAQQVGINSASNFIRSNGLASSQDDLQTANVFYKNPIGLGASVSRVRIRDFIQDQFNANGFVMGITTDSTKLLDNTLTIDDLDYGIRCGGASSVIQVKSGKGNAFVDNGAGITLSANVRNVANYKALNDNLSFELIESVKGEGQKMHMMLHKSAGIKRNILLKSDIVLRDGNDDDIQYYFVICMLGNDAHISLDGIGSVRNMFVAPPTFTNPHTQTGSELGAVPTVPTSNSGATIHTIKMSATVATYLGFETSFYSEKKLSPLQFIGTKSFETLANSDNYIVEMLNMNINSYDSYTKGRKNILSVVPVSETVIDTETGVIQYSPNFPLFLPLANDIKETKRNIRLRIVASDYSPVLTEGISSVNILIRS
tara:strand:+ start:692 stop:2257 length:1566 start_codon:yes stop_codon:yes gene_type:complete